ncbi:hypothetical protein ACFQ0M_07975 [Kitasatospora aburaviensis]
MVTETVFGSLLGRLAEAEPDLIQEQRPRFAADAQALTTAVDTALRKDPTRRVALVVDGLDHVTRVQGGRTRRADPSLALAAVLGSMPLPPGSVLIVLSQPGHHLVPLQDTGAASVAVPPLTAHECRAVAQRLRLVPAADDERTEALLTDDRDVTDFLDALQEHSGGNALYATYLCREVALRPETITKAAAVVRALPAYQGSLEGYYNHLYDTLGADAYVVADIIALLGMSVTREELEQIIPDRAHRIGGALKVLAPVLSGTAGPREIRVYHESFARYLRLGYDNDPRALESTLALIATWLTGKGLFDDSRAFRRLLQILAEAGRDAEVLDLIGRDFVTRAVATAHPASAIRDNLATGVRCAARTANWPLVARCVELARAAQTFEFERFESDLVEFADVPIALVGAQTLADRLLYDGRTVMPARAGLQMCAVLDEAGAVAPWHAYMTAHDHEAESDNTSYGAESDRAVELAYLRGRLRLSATDQGTGEEPREDGPGRPVSLDRITEWFDERGDQEAADAVVKTLLDTVGMEAVTDLVPRLETGGPVCLALAEQVAAGAAPEAAGSAADWAQKAADLGYVMGTAHRLLALGVAAADLAEGIAAEETSTARDALFSHPRRTERTGPVEPRGRGRVARRAGDHGTDRPHCPGRGTFSRPGARLVPLLAAVRDRPRPCRDRRNTHPVWPGHRSPRAPDRRPRPLHRQTPRLRPLPDPSAHRRVGTPSGHPRVRPGLATGVEDPHPRQPGTQRQCERRDGRTAADRHSPDDCRRAHHARTAGRRRRSRPQ